LIRRAEGNFTQNDYSAANPEMTKSPPDAPLGTPDAILGAIHLQLGSSGKARPMKIVIPGGSGQVGQILARDLVSDGHEVVVLSRRVGSGLVGRIVP